MKVINNLKNNFVSFSFTTIGILLISQSAQAVSLWDFEDNDSTTAFDSLDLNHGVYHNSLTATESLASFDGVDDYIEVADYPSLDFGIEDFFVSTRIKTNSQTFDVIVDKRVETSGQTQGFVFAISSGNLGFQLGEDSGFSNYGYGSNTFIADGEWHDVAVTVDRDEIDGGKFWIDGQVAGIFNPTGRQGSLSNDKPLTIGQRSDHPFWLGSLQAELDYVCVGTNTDLSQCHNSRSIPEPTSVLSLFIFSVFGVGAMFKRNLSKS